ncbi:hypothetical protein [Streptomyces antnestii]|uniref:hypothetical protein n=1 Tax=Streptomyces antnestii TaxID=2494256 RepID=UPI0016761829|nr:hypothetical protein [Streptomyces sp. San01]
MKSLLPAANCVAVGAVWETETPVVGLLLNGRPERTGADVTLGLFLSQQPMRLDLRGANWRTAARRALDAENALLPHRRFPHSELRRLLGRNPFEVTFNYVHFHPRDELLAVGPARPAAARRAARPGHRRGGRRAPALVVTRPG